MIPGKGGLLNHRQKFRFAGRNLRPEIEYVMDEYARYYKLLGYVLVEIRAANNQNRAQCLADVVHNLPSSIQIGRTAAEIEEHLIARASRFGMKGYFQTLLIACDKA